MSDHDKKELEQAFSRRNETLRSFYHTEALELSEDEAASLTPILNSLKDHIRRYREIEEIAEGGEKRITLAHDHRLDRRVAMARASSRIGRRPQDLEQFLREARLTANLAHPNIMPVYNMGLDEQGDPFFSMELVPGDSLKTIIRKLQEGDPEYGSAYTLETLLNIFNKICDAISYAHSRKVLHLDIKPDNIRVGDFGEVLVCDWGLARVVADAAREEQSTDQTPKLDADVLNDMTLSGTLKGTPGFMAPEQTQAYGTKNFQTDVYALGALLYMLLTHKLPVDGESAHEVIQNTRDGKVVPIRRRKTDRRIPKSLEAVTMKALSLKPEERYASVAELRKEIGRFLSGYPTEAENAGWIVQTSLLLHRHSRMAFLLIFFLIVLAFVISGNLVAISREKAQALAAKKEAEDNFQLYLSEQELTQSLGENLGEAVLFTVRSRDFVNAPAMINLLETGLSENVDTVRRKNLLVQKGILHFVLQEFSAAAACFDEAGEAPRVGQLGNLSRKYAGIKPQDRIRLTDAQLADLFNEGRGANQMTLFYLYYHHMRRRPNSATPQEYVPLAGAVLDKLNYTRRSRNTPLAYTAEDEERHLDLSDTPYSVFTINIVGIYRKNVLQPLRLTSLDISGTRIENLNELRGLKLDELRMADVELSNWRLLPRQTEWLQLKRIVLDAGKVPKEVLQELRKKMTVIDARKKGKAATPANRAGGGSPE